MTKEQERFTVRMSAETKAEIETIYRVTDCKSQNEFIEKAVKFYIGYLKQESNTDYLAPLISKSVEATVKSTEQRLSRNIFKTAVEVAKLANVVAAMSNIDYDTLEKLHAKCVNEVSRINGTIVFEDAYSFQKDRGD